MRALLVATLLALGPEASAQEAPAVPCAVPLGAPLQGGLEAIAEVSGDAPALLALAAAAVVRSADRGRSWTEVALVDEEEEDDVEQGDEEAARACPPVLAAAGRRAVALAGQEALFSEDGGRSFRRVGTSLDARPCAAALLDDGTLLAAADGGLVRLALSDGVFREEGRVDLGVDPERVAAGGGVVAVAGSGELLVSADRGRTFGPAARGDGGDVVVDLAVDRSGDVWLWTSAGVAVLDGAGARTPVLPLRPASAASRIAVGRGDGAVLLDGGELHELRPRCPAAGAAPPPTELSRPRRRRPAALAGLLPSVVLTVGLGPGRQAAWLELVLPLGRPSAAALSGWREVAEDDASLHLERGAAAWAAARRWAEGRQVLSSPWPPAGGAASVEAAVRSLAARAELAIWQAEP